VLNLDQDITIEGIGANPTLDGKHRHRVLRVQRGATVTIRGLLLRRGRPDSPIFRSRGGGVRNLGILILIDSIVRNNSGSWYGGGIYNAGTLRLIRTTVSRHGVDYRIQGHGGGIFNTGTATLVDSRISNNQTDYDGGGVYNTGILRLERSMVSSNQTSFGYGGGILNTGRVVLIDSSVTDNAGLRGGGIFNSVSDRPRMGMVSLRGSTVSGNQADLGPGGGIFNDRGATLVIRRASRVEENESSGRGGGIFNGGFLTIRHSIATRNTAGARGGGIFNNRHGSVTLEVGATIKGNTPDDCVGCNSLQLRVPMGGDPWVAEHLRSSWTRS
jgi:hypothetical protein